jgi:hypothetical protein
MSTPPVSDSGELTQWSLYIRGLQRDVYDC